MHWNYEPVTLDEILMDKPINKKERNDKYGEKEICSEYIPQCEHGQDG